MANLMSIKKYMEKMRELGFTEGQLNNLLSGARKSAKLEGPESEYAYPARLCMKLEQIVYEANPRDGYPIPYEALYNWHCGDRTAIVSYKTGIPVVIMKEKQDVPKLVR